MEQKLRVGGSVAAVAVAGVAWPGHLMSLFLPWGYLYLGPLLAAVLAVVAGATFRSRSRRGVVPQH